MPLLLKKLKKLKKCSQQGVTLLELLIVLSIVVILAVLALPTFLSFTQEYRLTATTQNLYYALQYARSEAVKRNQTVYVTFNTTDPWCYGINVGSACTCTTPTSCNLGTFSAVRTQDMTLSATGLNSNSLQFEGSRGVTTTGASLITFTVYGQTLAMSVKVTLLGNMQMCSSQVSGYPVCS
jgi:prepilin-type N-terminal cleavage/methylation domain-containing protein